MRCPSCGFDNPEGMKFCIECAAPLSAQSPASQTPDPGLRTPDFPRPRTSDPGLWTPPHLAERILAEQAALAFLFRDKVVIAGR